MKKIIFLFILFAYLFFPKNIFAASDIVCNFLVVPPSGAPNTSFESVGTNCHMSFQGATAAQWATRRIVIRILSADGIQIGSTSQASLDVTNPESVSFRVPGGGLTIPGAYTITAEDEIGSIIASQIFTITGQGPVMPICGSTVGSGGPAPPNCDIENNITGACCPFFCPAKIVYDEGQLNYRWVCTAEGYLCASSDKGLPGIQTAIGCIPIENTNDLIAFFVRWTMGIVGGVALLLIIMASYQIMTSQGDKYKLQSGKDMLTAALAGLLLAIFAIFIVRIFGQNILQIL